MARYSAGRIFLQVVPSFKGVQRETAREVNKLNKSMGDSMEKSGEESGRRAGRKTGGSFLMGFEEQAIRDQEKLNKVWSKVLVDLQRISAREYQKAQRDQEKLRKQDAARIEREESQRLRKIARMQAAAYAEDGRRRSKAAATALKQQQASLAVEEKALRASLARRGGAARKEIEKAIRGVDESFGSLNLARPVERELDKIRRKVRQTSAELSGGIINADEGRRKIERLGRDIERVMRRNSGGIDVSMRGNMRQAIRDINQMSHALDDMHGRGNRVSRFLRGLSGDGNDGANAFRIFNYRILAAVTALPLLVPLLATAAGGLVAFGSAALGAAAGLGVMLLAFSGIGDAVKALGDVQDSAAKDSLAASKTMRNAARGVRDAQQGLAQARLQAARSTEDANRRIGDAERRLADTQRRATEAQKDLREARLQAQRDQEALADKIRSGKLDERQALIDLFEAQTAYNAAIASGGATNLEKEQLSINLERAQLAIKGIREENADLAAEAKKNAKSGVEGSDAVVAAQERVRASQADVTEAERDVADARREAREQAVDNARTIRDAQERLTDAQEAYREAVTQTGALGSAAMQKLELAMGKLSPAGRAFALYLHSLRDDFYELRAAAQEGMFPGLMKAMDILFKRYGPGFKRFVSVMAKGMGDFFLLAAKVFTSPIWEQFFAMMERNSPMFGEDFGKVFLNVLTGIAAVMIAFEPIAVALSGWLVDISESFAKWATSLKDSESFQAFLGYLAKTGPKVWELLKVIVKAFVAIGVAFAPYADKLLDFAISFFGYIAELDPHLLGTLVGAILGFVLASQLAAGATQLWLTLATPFHSVIGAIVFLLVGLGLVLFYAYTHWDAFREVVDKVIGFIKDNKETFVWLAGAFLTIAGTVFGAWKILSLFIGRIAAFRIILGLVTGPVGWIILGITLLVAAFIWAWKNVDGFAEFWKKVWDGIVAVVMWVWNYILKPYFAFLTFVFSNLMAIVKWVFSIINPILELFGAIVRKIWEKVIGPALGWIGGKFSWLGSKIKSVWMEYIDPILDKFGLGANDLKKVWQVAIDAIGRAWEGLKSLVWKPLDFIVNTVINKGFVDNFNKLAKFFGTTPIKHLVMPALGKAPTSGKASYGGGGSHGVGGYATGGYTGAGQKYAPAGIVHRDEFVIRKESTNKIRSRYGLEVLDYINRFGDLPGMGGYAHGGLVAMGRRLQGLGFRVSEHPAFGGVQGSHSRTGWHYRGGAIDVNWPNGQRQSAEETRKINAILYLAKQYGLRTIWQYPNHYDHVHFDIDHGRDLGNFSGAGKGSGGGDMPWWIEKPMEAIKDFMGRALSKLPDNGISGFIKGIPKKLLSMAESKIMDMIGGAGDYAGGGDGNGIGAGVLRWKDVVLAALRRVGQPASLLDVVLARMDRESSGNPRAINNWDSNALRGTPSKGLMQVIDPTFATWRDRRLVNNIYDPLANVTASMRYAMNRYGGLAAAYNRAGGYSEGGLVDGLQDNGTMMYDNGGYLPPGITQVVNLTGRPEPVFTGDQWDDMAGGGGRSLIGHLEVDVNGADLSAGDVVDEIMWQVARVEHGGKYAGRSG